MTTPTEIKYASIEPLQRDNPSTPQEQVGRLMARLVARYRLAAVPGRPEELVLPGTHQAVSVGYGCRTIRVRQMVGRVWVDHVDLQLNSVAELGPVYALLDGHFGYDQPGITKIESA